MRDWPELERLSKSKKSPIGYEVKSLLKLFKYNVYLNYQFLSFF